MFCTSIHRIDDVLESFDETIQLFVRMWTDLYVVAKVEEHASEYQGMLPDSDAELTVMVYMEVAYPSQLQLSL